jgi:methyl-accepting chemotaxis protein
MSLKSIKAKIWIFAAFLTLLLFSQSVMQLDTQRQLSDSLTRLSEQQLEILLLSYQLKESTVQVQQWLTDISATRGLDGLNDGFDLAADYAELFRESVRRLVQIDPTRSAKYQNLLPIFQAYVDMGVRMAESYVTFGPSSGNVLMEDFDAEAIAINDAVDDILSAEKSAMQQQLSIEVDASNRALQQLYLYLSIYAISLAGIILFSHFGIAKPIQKLASLVEELYQSQISADKQVDAKSLDQDRRNEIGEVGYWLAQLLNALDAQYQTAERAAKENLRIRTALDEANSSVILANTEHTIIYANRAMKQLLEEGNSAFKEAQIYLTSENIKGASLYALNSIDAIRQISLDSLDREVSVQASIGMRTYQMIHSPVLNDEGERLGTIIEWQDLTEALAKQAAEQKRNQQNEQIRQALNCVSANVMVADHDTNIIYMNEAAERLMRNAATDFQKAVPKFDPNRIIGQSFDLFHKNPRHQQSLLSQLTTTHFTELNIGGRSMNLTANPIIDEQGSRLGTVVEWEDRTAEAKLEHEIDQIVQGAAEGHLDTRIDETQLNGFFLKLGRGLNQQLGSVSKFVDDVSKIFASLARGELNKNMSQDYRGNFAAISENANQSLTKISEIMTQIGNSSELVRTAASEIAQGNSDLSDRTVKQASSLEQTAANLNEVTQGITGNSELASQASTLANNARDEAQKGSLTGEQTIKAMEEIASSSAQINDIIGTIDEIAFQTNLLALNASVEAARAGDQGRGFAVVAAEVRTLSQRSAGAAKQIKELIMDSNNRVNNGSELVKESGEVLKRIMEAVERSANVIQQVNDSSQQQSKDMQSITQALSQMDEMTQQNSALVEEAAAAAQSMSDESLQLAQRISFFITKS